MKFVEKEIPEGINVTPHNPLLNFAHLLGTVVVLSIVIFVALGYIAEWLASRLSPETEGKIGQMLMHTVSEEIQEDSRIQYIETLLHSLSESEEKIRLPLTVHLIEDEVINAAIMPGGHVLVHTALLEKVESENELVFILAHELGHFQARDSIKSLGRSLVFVTAYLTLGISSFLEWGGFGDVVPMTEQLAGLHYSRQQEKTADIYALSKMIKRYGHAGHSLDFFERLDKESEKSKQLEKVSQYFSTHPSNPSRINYLNKTAAKNGWNMAGETTSAKWLQCPDMKECKLATD
ncbi:M48 family metallopeptidase [Candidatus Parabeggiatoa sp. HSG14]|uniref:M48 family metallopeptidase n=1 Tax=Candidatus Parabeggiatoa sp. HSG14 TaxID=3055593 RepID=UPI0025A8A587|nr:M48 family metallopeptidase [Thiotrichales bacterium HSG14]